MPNLQLTCDTVARHQAFYSGLATRQRRSLFNLSLLCIICAVCGCGNITEMHPILGDWERVIVFGHSPTSGTAHTQVDRYTFHADGTFDHQRTLDFLSIQSGVSGIWYEENGRIVCESNMHNPSGAYRDLLLVSDDGSELIDLESRARGVPPYYRFGANP